MKTFLSAIIFRKIYVLLRSGFCTTDETSIYLIELWTCKMKVRLKYWDVYLLSTSKNADFWNLYWKSLATSMTHWGWSLSYKSQLRNIININWVYLAELFTELWGELLELFMCLFRKKREKRLYTNSICGEISLYRLLKPQLGGNGGIELHSTTVCSRNPFREHDWQYFWLSSIHSPI